MDLVGPGLDLGQIQNVVDEVEQVLPGVVDIFSVIAIFDASDSPIVSSLMISENPMIAFSGVRSSWLIAARNSDLARFAASA